MAGLLDILYKHFLHGLAADCRTFREQAGFDQFERVFPADVNDRNAIGDAMDKKPRRFARRHTRAGGRVRLWF